MLDAMVGYRGRRRGARGGKRRWGLGAVRGNGGKGRWTLMKETYTTAELGEYDDRSQRLPDCHERGQPRISSKQHNIRARIIQTTVKYPQHRRRNPSETRTHPTNATAFKVHKESAPDGALTPGAKVISDYRHLINASTRSGDLPRMSPRFI